MFIGEGWTWRSVVIALMTGMVIGLVVPLIFIAFLSGCATSNKPTCTFVCPNNNIPTDCYCLEDEIKREADRMVPPDSNGFHP